MKIKLGDYFVVGGFGQKSVFIKNDYSLPYYVSKKDLETKQGGVRVPAGAVFVATIMIRSIDSKNLQANPLLLIIGFIVIYFSVEWFFKDYKNTNHEVNEYKFQNDEIFESFIQDSQKRNKVLVNFYLTFLVVTLVSAYFYLVTNIFVFLFISLAIFLCFALLAKYQPIKRIYVLHKIKKELIR